MSRTYVTTFCNFPHVLKTGRPVGHECYILPPKGLEAERVGDLETALKLFETKGPVVKPRSVK